MPYFTKASLDFFTGLREHTSKPWFEAHREDYERHVKEPMQALVAAMDARFARFAPEIGGDPRRSVFRLHRDIRFSKDKSPYKTHVAADFPWRGDGEGHRWGGGYFHLQPGEVYLGGGMWHPEPSWLAAWRQTVDTSPKTIHAAIDDPAFVKRFKDVHGDSLKRVPPGFDKDHPEGTLLKLKDVTFGLRLDDKEVQSAKLPTTIASAFADAVPVFRLFASIGA